MHIFIMINDYIENINLDETTSLKQLFSSFDRSNEDDYGIELQHSAYYCINNYIDILRQYENGLSILNLNIQSIDAKLTNFIFL